MVLWPWVSCLRKILVYDVCNVIFLALLLLLFVSEALLAMLPTS